MPKKIKFESFKYRLLMAATDPKLHVSGGSSLVWGDFVRSLVFSYEKGSVSVSWPDAGPRTMRIPLDEARLFCRGDELRHVLKQVNEGLLTREDPVKLGNDAYFKDVVARLAEQAGYRVEGRTAADDEKRWLTERSFHDAWADSADIGAIDVQITNEACTAPEMRCIAARLGDLKGKRLLDVGCGLGEASVYFAMRGAEVTASDLSPGMLEATSRLARANGVSVHPHLSAAEDMQLDKNDKFDVIYAGNLLHHVDIDQTLGRVTPHMAENGLFVSWDPLAYNPVINIYRAIATSVRTPDEHPLRFGDIQLFRRHFESVDTRYFWLLTLSIFVLMALLQRRNPNKERFWKVVVQEGEKWRWLYAPLEKVDHLILKLLPPLRLLCWNVVIVASRPIRKE